MPLVIKIYIFSANSRFKPTKQNNIMMMNFESQQLDEEYIANETILRDYKNR
jgi:hypothetical protein